MMPKLRSLISYRLGRRGTILLLFGIIWFLIGYDYVTIEQNRFSASGPDSFLDFMDNPPWPGTLWILGGVLSVSCALFRGYSLRDDYGFNGLAIPPFVWACAYFLSWFNNEISGGEFGQNNWRESLQFVIITIVVLFLARWPDPDDPHLQGNNGGDEVRKG